MAHYFKETDIDEFRECFFLFARSGRIQTISELTIIMRSLGLSPTIAEITNYLQSKAGSISFADFLEIMHKHSKKENLPTEILKAFQASSSVFHNKQISVQYFRHILENRGESLTPKEVDRTFSETNISKNQKFIDYEDVLKVLCSPIPDYY